MPKKDVSFSLPIYMLAVKHKTGHFMALSDDGKNMALAFTSLEPA